MSPTLTALLRCPETGQSLRAAREDELALLRTLGQDCSGGALVREDNGRAFPVVDGFPVLLPGASLLLGGPSQRPSDRPAPVDPASQF